MGQNRWLATLSIGLSGVVLCSGQRVITTFAGSDITYPTTPFPANGASFGQLISVALSPSGKVYFVSESRSMILAFDPSTNKVSVVAGIGIPGYSGDGGPATKAELSNPQDIIFDSPGNLYIADNGNSVIRKIDTQGTITTVAAISDPVGLTFGPDGTLYVSNYYEVVHVGASGSQSVVAGGSLPGFSGDGGPATAAQLSNASGILFDKTGNLLIADSLNNRIRRVDTRGVITTIAGNGQSGVSAAGAATSTAIGYPIGLLLDASGNLYTGNINNHQLVKISSSGQLSVPTIQGPTSIPGAVNTPLITPAWEAFDNAGNMYITDSYAGVLWEISPAGTANTVAGFSANFALGDNGPAVSAGLSTPSAVWAAADGSILVAEALNQRIRRISPTGTITTVAGNGIYGTPTPGPATASSLQVPGGVATDSAGNLYLISDGTVFKVSSAGILSTFYQGAGAVGIFVDAQNNVLVAAGNQIIKVSPSGAPTVIAGTGQAGYNGDGIPATSAKLNSPTGVAADAAGNIYIADNLNYRVRKISTNGNISTIGGGGGTEVDGVQATQSFAIPDAIAVDKSGNIYFTEFFNNRVREIATSGIISTITGTGNPGFSGDGGLATAAAVDQPAGIAVDASGNVYIADRLNNRIRELLVTAPSISVSLSQVTTSAASSGTPVQTTINVSSSAPGVGYAVSATPQTGGNWLSANLAQGQAPGSFTITADPTNLPATTYQGTITVTSPNAVPAMQSIPVMFKVSPANPPKLSAGGSPLNFALTQGSAPVTAQLTISNQGGGSLSFTATPSTAAGGSWLSVSSTSGTATPSAPTSLTVTVTPGTLGVGTYSGSIVVASSTTGETVTVGATLAISPSRQNIVLSQSGLTYLAVENGGAPLPQSFGILNTGQGSMVWSAGVSTLPAGGSWLSIDQANGVVATPLTDVSVINVKVDPTGLKAGSYYGQVTVNVPGVPNSPQSVSVVLNVLTQGASPGAEVQPSGLIFVGQAGSSPGAQNVMISNPLASAVTYGGSFFSVPTGGNWVRFLPVNATVQPNSPVSMLVQPDYSSLTAGVYQGFVSLGFADGTTKSVHVLAVVSAPNAAVASADGLVAQASPNCSALQVQPTSLTDPGASVTIGAGASLQVKVVDGCGNAVTSNNGAVGATFNNGDASVNLVHVGNGNWSGTWTPHNGASSQTTITYKALSGSGTSLWTGSATLTVSVLPATTSPVTVGANNSASGLGAFISPGGLISIYGQQLANAAATSGAPPFPTNVNGTKVLLGGIALPLRYVGGGQINAQVPFGLGINTQQQLIVQNGNSASVPQNVMVAAAQPGIYTQDQSGKGPAVVTDFQLGNAEVTPSNPAHVGDTLTIYCNGLGATNPPVPTGTPAPSTEPLARTASTTTVTIGNVNAIVQYAGLAPGYPDLYQVNVVVPLGVVPGSAVPIVLTVASQSSPSTVTIAVQ